MKIQSDNSIENASIDTIQICAYIENEMRSLKESIARKRKTMEQLEQEIEKDEKNLEGLETLLGKIKTEESKADVWQKERECQ